MLQKSLLTLGGVVSQGVHTLGRIPYAIARGFRAVGQGIAGAFLGVVNAIDRFFRTLVRGIAGAFRAVGQGIARFFRSVVNTITGAFRALGRGIARLFRSVVNAITGAFRALGRGIARLFRSVVNAITGAFRALGRGIARAFLAVVHKPEQAIQRFRVSFDQAVYRFRPTTLTLSIESSMLRVVAFKGHEVVAWKSASLEEAPDGQDEADEPLQNGSSPLRTVLEEMPVGRARLLTDLPLYGSLIRHLRLPKVRRSYLDEMVLSEVLETLPFEQDEVDIRWHLRQDQTDTEAFAVAVPKSNIDGQVQLIKEAGLSPSAAYTKALALAFVAKVPDVIVVHLDRIQVAAVLVRGGVPRVVHQVELPAEGFSLQEQADTLTSAVDRVAGYYQTQDPESEGDPLPVVFTGKTPDTTGLLELMPQVLQRPVLPLDPVMDYPEQFPPDEYAANLGLFLADQARGKAWGKTPSQAGPSLNVLPDRHLPRPLPVVPIAVLTSLFLLLLLAIVVTGPINDKTNDADRLLVERDQAQRAERAALATQIERLGLRREQEETLVQLLGMESSLAELKVNIDTLLARLTAITEDTASADIRLSGLAPGERGFVLAGTASNYEAVFNYATNLRDSPHLENASVQTLTGSGQGAVGFTMVATVPEPVVEEDAEEGEEP